MNRFTYSPTPAVLHWLSGGHLSSRLARAIRCWVWLQEFYSDRGRLTALPQPFSYGDVRDCLFSPRHPRAETTPLQHVTSHCQESSCLCQQSAQTLIFRSQFDLSPADWVAASATLSGLSPTVVERQLDTCPFATVHRTLRDDLKHLAAQGWLLSLGRGKFKTVAPAHWPLPPRAIGPDYTDGGLSSRDIWSLLHILEPIAFLQPQLAVVVDTLWRQATHQPRDISADAPQRVFVHLDYIVPNEAQDWVDQHQVDIETLWHQPDGGVIQFDNWSARQQQLSRVTVYPVCFHYARRAKYLSAFGETPEGSLGWHNYRLDRIRSPRLRVLPWGDPAVPETLKRLRQMGQLPDPAQVQAALDEAWGFNFYLPKALLLLRFPPEFARWYVQDTVRHPTFTATGYRDLPGLIEAEVPEPTEQRSLLAIVAQRPSTDAYYWGYIRVGDINVTMRLRDWRPMGEVIAPLVVRQQMVTEATVELEQYGTRENT